MSESRENALLEALYEIRGHLKEADRQDAYGREMDVAIREAIRVANDAIKANSR